MSLPTDRQDKVGNLVSRTELGIPTSLLANEEVDGDGVATPGPLTQVLLIDIASGEMTVRVSVYDETPDFGSPTATLVVDDTTTHAILFNTASATLNFAVQVEETAGTPAAVTGITMGCLSLAGLTAGEEWVNITSGTNAVLSTKTGDGSGVFVALS